MSVSLDGVMQTLDAMLRYWRGGARWTRWTLDDGSGNKCVVGAVTSVRARSSDGASWVPTEEIEAAKRYISMAVQERSGLSGDGGIMTFNDTRWSYRTIAAVIERAKELATASYYAHAQRRPAPVPVIDMTPEPVRTALEILPPYNTWPALPPPDGSPRLFAGRRTAPVAAPPVAQRIAANSWTTPAPRRLPRY